jgi:tRNA (cmo5U34)-methyltransferase
MPDTGDTNAAVWKSDLGVNFWKSTQEDRERRRAGQRTLLAELLPFAADEPFTFVDLGAGTGAAARIILDHYAAAHAILADFSPQMMAQGETDLKPYKGRYTYVEFDLTAADAWPDGIPDPVDAAISSLSVHHLNDARKQTLFAEILIHLAPGGWYLNYDPVAPPDTIVEEAWLRAGDRQDPTAAANRANRTHEEQFRYENHVRHMIPLDPQVGFLRAAGFEGVDVFWKNLDFVIYGGRRPLLFPRIPPSSEPSAYLGSLCEHFRNKVFYGVAGLPSDARPAAGGIAPSALLGLFLPAH